MTMRCGPHEMDLAPPLQPMLGIAFVNFVFVIISLLVCFSFFATPSAFEVRLPAEERPGVEESHVSIRITAENVLYFNGKVVTLNDLKRGLVKINPRSTVIYIQVDRRASMGRTVDVWDLCKGLGLAEIKIISSQG